MISVLSLFIGGFFLVFFALGEYGDTALWAGIALLIIGVVMFYIVYRFM
jgi:hypothetical protein